MLVIGLGNPGKEYEKTRHNVGRDLLLDISHGDPSFSDWKREAYSNTWLSRNDEKGIIFALPDTFMNRSGDAVRFLQRKFNLEIDNILVIYDDIDLPFKSVKLSKSRGSGGHNGVQSIIDHLSSNEFVRLRVGICPVLESGEKAKPDKESVNKFVLNTFTPSEREAIEELQPTVWSLIKSVKEEGFERSANIFNAKESKKSLSKEDKLESSAESDE